MNYEVTNDLWKYDISTSQWHQLNPQNTRLDNYVTRLPLNCKCILMTARGNILIGLWPELKMRLKAKVVTFPCETGD